MHRGAHQRRLCAETCRSLDEMNRRSGRWRSFAGVPVIALVGYLSDAAYIGLLRTARQELQA